MSVTIAGLKIKVILQKAENASDPIGHADYANQRIILNSGIVTDDMLEQAYLHELTHFILFVMGYPELRDNEKFVDLFAHFLYQAQVSKEDRT